ncbi:hypothetical protein FHR90_000415 [Endobacter medicaginis]|uniref:Uncharacterized protein n=1 Tax=Endobacter medicaginis TaxID=1181271 RepID=A0A839UZ86_9PROT|nr:hypothetical protein [Endobacter medicaginis]MBB3172601.1 hypothetical protein [Endobacter medicaginis]MCX5476864.1 hypothetical protein [Endobacter medicaginis]NVN29379.1 hypothetical protein [Endobacter medicaginis]
MPEIISKTRLCGGDWLLLVSTKDVDSRTLMTGFTLRVLRSSEPRYTKSNSSRVLEILVEQRYAGRIDDRSARAGIDEARAQFDEIARLDHLSSTPNSYSVHDIAPANLNGPANRFGFRPMRVAQAA